MDLLAAILKEHSKAQTARIVRYVGKDKKKFAELMKLFLEGEYRVTQRSGWPLSICVEKYPELIQPYFKKYSTTWTNPAHMKPSPAISCAYCST